MDQTDSRLAHSPEPTSDDAASPPNSAAPGGADQASPGEPLPWEGEPPEETGRRRHDAFTGARKQLYLKALAKHGCILDACRVTGISSSTVYNHQASDPDFERHCRLALDMASTPIELTAYERAVVGQEEPVIRGGKVVGTRIKRSDYMLRVLLQGTDPKKYGPRPGFTRKRLLKFERKQIEREVRGRLAEHRPPIERVTERMVERVENIKRHRNRQLCAQGWTDLGCGVWVPPGWVWAGEGDPSERVAQDLKKGDAVCNSSNLSTSLATSSADAEAEAEAEAKNDPVTCPTSKPPLSGILADEPPGEPT
jgi:hypothetical protein